MNRKEKRVLIRNHKGKKGLGKKHAKGAFGKISHKASEQLDLRIIPKSKRKLTEPTETKEVTKESPKKV